MEVSSQTAVPPAIAASNSQTRARILGSGGSRIDRLRCNERASTAASSVSTGRT
jgi:hypothetical protein